MAAENDTKPLDPLADLLDSYEALADLAMDRLGTDSPTCVLLRVLNQQFRGFLDSLNVAGMLS